MLLKYDKKVILMLLAIIVTPSLVFTNLVEGYELPKTIFITVLLLLGIIGKKHNFSFKETKFEKFNYLELVVYGYLGLYLVSTVFAIDIGTAMFGYYGRFAGSLAFISAILLFLLNSVPQLKETQQSNLFSMVSVGSVIPILYSYIQLFNLESLAQTSNRIISTFGQPNWLGAYLVVILLINAISYVEQERNISLFYFTFALIPLLYTLSISSFVTILVCLAAFALLRVQKETSLRFYTLIFFFVITFLIHGQNLGERLSNQVIAQQENQTQILTNDTGYIRKILTESSAKQILSSPKLLLVGAGPENFAYAFNRPKELNQTSEWFFLYNKPHNLFVEEFFETGFLGLFIFLLLTGFTFFNIKKYAYALIPFGILLNASFGWLTSYMYLVLFIFLFKLALDRKIDLKFSSVKKIKNIPSFFLYDAVFAFVILFFFSISTLGINPCLSYKIFPYYQNFAYSCLEGNITSENAQSIIRINPDNTLIKEKIALEVMESNLKYSETLLTELFERNPNNPVYLYYLGVVNEKMGKSDTAIDFYLKALELQPKFIQAQAKLHSLL